MAKQLVVVCWVTITKKLKAFELQLCSSYTLIDMSCWHKMLSHSYINDLKIFLCQCVMMMGRGSLCVLWLNV